MARDEGSFLVGRLLLDSGTRGSAKSDSLLGDQEAVYLQVVAGARNHLQANRSVEFRIEIVI